MMAEQKGSQHAGSSKPAGGVDTPWAYKKRDIPAHKKVLRVGWVGTGPFSFYSHYVLVINTIFRADHPYLGR